jgi:transposase
MTDKTLQTNDTQPVRLLVALELSLKTWRLAMAVAGAPKKRFKTIAGGDYVALGQAIEESKTKWGLDVATPVVFCYEAGRDGFYPYRQLTAAGHTVWVIDSASIEVSRRKRRAKSDGIDADKLLGLLQRYVGGETTALRVVRVPAVAVEDLRILPRERETLLQERQRLRNRIESALFGQGYRALPKTAKRLAAWLQERTDVGDYLKARLNREVARLALVEAQLREVDARQAEVIQTESGTAAAGEVLRIAQALQGLVGIGLVGAWVLACELFGWRDFHNRREVGGALGLTPTPYSSGEDQREQGISKAGNRRARSMLIELAWLWLRYQPDSALSQWYRTRFASGGKRPRRVGIVALARRLAVALWRYVKTGAVPAGAKLKPVSVAAN